LPFLANLLNAARHAWSQVIFAAVPSNPFPQTGHILVFQEVIFKWLRGLHFDVALFSFPPIPKPKVKHQ